MGKHKHSKDKLYVLHSELKGDTSVKKKIAKDDKHRRMPFNYCCISQCPFTEPYCDSKGNMYDKKSVLEIMAAEKAEGKTEFSIDINKLIKVNFHKRGHDFICPITRKCFNSSSKIIINKKTGNVYSSAAIAELYKNKKEMYDPLTHELMSESDLIVLQNYIHKDNKWATKAENEDLSESLTQVDSSVYPSHIRESGALESVLQEVRQKEEKEKEREKEREKKYISKNKKDMYIKKGIYRSEVETAVDVNANEGLESESDNELKIKCKNYSNSALAQSVTSTVCDPIYTNEILYLSEAETFEEVYKVVRTSKRNSYVSLITDLGVINLELYASTYPQLCHNFLLLCDYRYFDKTEMFKLDREVVYFGSQKNNYHKAASGFYWRKKVKKNNLRNKIRKKTSKNNISEEGQTENTEEISTVQKDKQNEREAELEVSKFKETLKNVNSDNDSDIDCKYVKCNDNRHIRDEEPFGNIYMFKYYNQKYANMFYICLSDDHTDNNISIGRVVGGYATLDKLRNVTFENECENYQLVETIVYTNPFTDVIEQIKKKIANEEKEKEKDKEKEKEKKKEEIKVPTDEELVENKFDDVGKYIDWEKLETNIKTTKTEITQNTRTDLIKKLLKNKSNVKYDDNHDDSHTNTHVTNRVINIDATTTSSDKIRKQMNFDCW